mmetsp:Transcript_18095/g.58580  ORF Transcript_18095/g.58580 Transcript_18095/m.58580 type:complete len:331 (+) Transcript_18095:187-1179(+)
MSVSALETNSTTSRSTERRTASLVPDGPPSALAAGPSVPGRRASAKAQTNSTAASAGAHHPAPLPPPTSPASPEEKSAVAKCRGGCQASGSSDVRPLSTASRSAEAAGLSHALVVGRLGKKREALLCGKPCTELRRGKAVQHTENREARPQRIVKGYVQHQQVVIRVQHPRHVSKLGHRDRQQKRRGRRNAKHASIRLVALDLRHNLEEPSICGQLAQAQMQCCLDRRPVQPCIEPNRSLGPQALHVLYRKRRVELADSPRLPIVRRKPGPRVISNLARRLLFARTRKQQRGQQCGEKRETRPARGEHHRVWRSEEAASTQRATGDLAPC